MISKYSIAVLPFVNMSSDTENEYFSDGVTDEIINALAKIKGLHVTSRTSSFAFKDQTIDVREIGQKLNVSLLLEGSVRKSKDHVRITAQLIKVEDGFHIWSDNWDRELKDIFILQDEIASIIAEKVNSKIENEHADTAKTIENTDALDYYLKGQYALNQWDFNEAENIISNFEKAIEIDSKFVHGYIGLANATTWLGSTGYISPVDAHKKVEFCIERISILDNENPDIYSILAGKNFWIEWNLPLALENINKAVELKPSFAEAFIYKGLIEAALGKVEEALNSLFYCERLNPYSDTVNYVIALIYNLTGDKELALKYIDRNIKICPHWYAQYLTQIELLCAFKRFDEAFDLVKKLEEDEKSPLSIHEIKGYIYASINKREDALKEIEKMKEELKAEPLKENPSNMYFALIYFLIGNYHDALDYIEQGMKNRSAPMLFMKIDTRWKQIRYLKRFSEAVKILDFPEIDNKNKKYLRSSVSKKQAKEIETNLNDRMKSQKLFLSPTLNLSDLAESNDISTNLLSQVLNEHIGKNFYDFVNSYRLDHFLKLHKDPKNKQFTILSLAYDCGFNSKTTFNTFFKKTLGSSPSDYFKIN